MDQNINFIVIKARLETIVLYLMKNEAYYYFLWSLGPSEEKTWVSETSIYPGWGAFKMGQNENICVYAV